MSEIKTFIVLIEIPTTEYWYLPQTLIISFYLRNFWYFKLRLFGPEECIVKNKRGLQEHTNANILESEKYWKIELGRGGSTTSSLHL